MLTVYIIRSIGFFLQIPSILMLTAIPVCLIYEEFYALLPFGVTAILGIGIGQLLIRAGTVRGKSELSDAVATAALGWLLCAAVGMIPIVWTSIYLSGTDLSNEAIEALSSPLNAFFESMSGFTTTGLSMVRKPDLLPYTILWWRSLMQWAGGIGLAVFVIAITYPVVRSYELFKAEAKTEKISESIKSTSREIFIIYSIYTILGVILFLCCGVSFWESVNHSLTAISTGGFSVNRGSLEQHSYAAQSVAMFVMLLGAISLPIHYKVLIGKDPMALWKNTEHRQFFLIVVLGSVFLILINLLEIHEIASMKLIFQWVASCTTCGLSTDSLHVWSPELKVLLIAAMFIGGTSGSSAGGFKQFRVLNLFSAMRRQFTEISEESENGEKLTKKEKKKEESKEIKRISNFYEIGVLFSIWMFTIFVGWIFFQLQLENIKGLEGLFEVVSALSNVGLSAGVTGAEMPDLSKYGLIFLMWFGRLEIVPVIFLFFFLPRALFHRVSSQKE